VYLRAVGKRVDAFRAECDITEESLPIKDIITEFCAFAMSSRMISLDSASKPH
jgi:hypothetical protein